MTMQMERPAQLERQALAERPAQRERSPQRGRPEHEVDEYADVMEMFHAMHGTMGESAEVARQREAIFNRCLALADRIARHYGGRGEDIEDLTQVARLGLVKAVNRFDPAKGSHFVAFAVPTMMGEVRRHFRDHGWSMHVPRRLKDRHGNISRATTELTQSLGRAPTAGQLAEYLDMSREDIVDSMLAAEAYRVHSIDAPVSSGDSAPRMVSDTVGSVDFEFDRITDQETVRPLLAALPERERTVLYLRFFESMTQSQIAERVGVSQMHVSRILEKTLRELRAKL
nr:SigB/SigF/SigG family RNA polymerase sigma factor [Mycolicibacterium hodleri]